MALWIQNVTADFKNTPDDQPHDYALRINDKLLATFQHVRSEGAAECLRAAANAIEEKELEFLEKEGPA